METLVKIDAENNKVYTTLYTGKTGAHNGKYPYVCVCYVCGQLREVCLINKSLTFQQKIIKTLKIRSENKYFSTELFNYTLHFPIMLNIEFR